MENCENREKLLHDSSSIMSHMFLGSIHKKEDIEKLKDDKNWEITVNINGISISLSDADEFLKDLVDRNYLHLVKKEANKMYEDKKSKFMTKNSPNAKLQKIKELLDKANNTLLNIQSSINQFEYNEE